MSKNLHLCLYLSLLFIAKCATISRNYFFIVISHNLLPVTHRYVRNVILETSFCIVRILTELHRGARCICKIGALIFNGDALLVLRIDVTQRNK